MLNMQFKGGRDLQEMQIRFLIEKIYSLGYFPDGLNLYIEIGRDDMLPSYGEAAVIDFDTYYLAFHAGCNRFTIPLLVCHEMIHVYQHYVGLLATTFQGTQHAWKGESTEHLDYMDLPHEIMAWGQQAKLLKEIQL
jgi:hypothetical protein